MSPDATVDPTHPRTAPGLRRLAAAVAVCTLVLVFLGGSVTSNDAGLAFPDWPTVEGRNMFLYPPSAWVGDKLFEHVHRLAGAAVGLLSIALLVWTQRREPRRWVRVFAWIILAAVIVQGVMGGLRVTERSIALAIIHGCFAQLFFACTVCMVVFLAPGWFNGSAAAPATSAALRRFCVLTTVCVFGQLIVGAIYRHLGSGLVLHVVGAVVVTIMISVLVMWISGEHPTCPLLMRLMKLVGLLFVVQLALGVAAYVATRPHAATRAAAAWEWLVPSLHVAVGAAILGMLTALTACAYRFGEPRASDRTRSAPAGAHAA